MLHGGRCDHIGYRRMYRKMLRTATGMTVPVSVINRCLVCGLVSKEAQVSYVCCGSNPSKTSLVSFWILHPDLRQAGADFGATEVIFEHEQPQKSRSAGRA